MKHKIYYRVLEYIWLMLAVIATIFFIHSVVTKGLIKDNLTLVVIAVISILMYFYRRNQRKKDSI